MEDIFTKQNFLPMYYYSWEHTFHRMKENEGIKECKIIFMSKIQMNPFLQQNYGMPTMTLAGSTDMVRSLMDNGNKIAL